MMKDFQTLYMITQLSEPKNLRPVAFHVGSRQTYLDPPRPWEIVVKFMWRCLVVVKPHRWVEIESRPSCSNQGAVDGNKNQERFVSTTKHNNTNSRHSYGSCLVESSDHGQVFVDLWPGT